MAKRILLVGGGSGGHVFPLVAVSAALRRADPSVELYALGEGRFMADAMREAGIPFTKISAGKLRRYASARTFLAPVQFLWGFIQSLWHLFRIMPDAVFTKGSYASVAPSLVARLYRIPVYTHESDSVPGRANLFISKLSKTTFISFADSKKYFKEEATLLTGNPIRPEVLQGQREAALKHFNFRADKQTIFIFGGSQGSKRINDSILQSLVQIVPQYQVIHQCGDSQLTAVTAEIERLEREGERSYGPMIKANYRLFAFLSVQEVALAYAAADVVISRAGSSNLFEIAALGKPAIVIPITHSNGNHQVQNAVELSLYGAVMIEEANLTPHILINQIQDLLDPARWAERSAKIKTFAAADAAAKIAEVLLK
ncbi:MAG TPA: UDP-N-acetylglucosamine--N-acetylmuramyl-(pentapeptide) pyrophosphoryl-undecaprenol N-acetylglucosamine transferase [Candidatus Paceibacterota bacterium]|nr:UDP-N-acetylglucosamine--N-acetylmuramyl-(pentapeptide) pyrophosphoryl-undecaprenol N-acetylglucosamine transferase [Candidatus Paceibacterota bacterium]